MKRRNRTYTREFKLETLRLYETSGKSASQIERDLGISRGCIYRWKKAFAEEGEQAFPGHGRLTPDQEQIRQLKRENEILRQQRELDRAARRYSGSVEGKKLTRVQGVVHALRY
jgi:transposase